MNVINLTQQNSVLSQFVSEIRDIDIQSDPIRFRRNIERIGEIMAYEISKTFQYEDRNVQTPLGVALCQNSLDKLILATILRAGLPLHQGFLNYFDGAENAFVSAYRHYLDDEKFEIRTEYLASPRLDGKNLLIIDPMLATGRSLAASYHALLTKGIPAHVHIASVIATDQAVDYLRNKLPESEITIWTAALDHELNSHSYIIPGLGDAGDLCYGVKD